MKTLFVPIAFCVCVVASFVQAAIPTDTNVTLLKVKKVTIEESVIIIVAEKATTRITLFADDQDRSYKGETRDGKPVTTVQSCRMKPLSRSSRTVTPNLEDRWRTFGRAAWHWPENCRLARRSELLRSAFTRQMSSSNATKSPPSSGSATCMPSAHEVRGWRLGDSETGAADEGSFSSSCWNSVLEWAGRGGGWAKARTTNAVSCGAVSAT